MNRIHITYISFFALLFFYECSVKGKYQFPNLAIGEFKVKFKAIIKCESSPNNKMHLYLRLHKLSQNRISIKANVTSDIPLDDSLTLNVNLAIKDSVGGWKDNAHIITLPKACTSMKFLLGDRWPQFLKALNIKNPNCPIIPGDYFSDPNGIEVTNNATFISGIKTFFYGTYKCRFYYTDIHHVQHGCIMVVVEIVRPWDTD